MYKVKDMFQSPSYALIRISSTNIMRFLDFECGDKILLHPFKENHDNPVAVLKFRTQQPNDTTSQIPKTDFSSRVSFHQLTPSWL
jgi:hypothetical protein